MDYSKLTKKQLINILVAEKAAIITGPDDVVEYLSKTIKDWEQEHFIALYLNNKNKIMGHYIVSKGTATYTLVHPRDVFRGAILKNAISVIIAHNHPSGDCEPSQADRDMTKRLVESGNILQIKVIDHIIFNQAGEQLSFNSKSLL